MRQFAIVLSLVLLASAVQAQTIADIQQGLVPEDTLVTLTGVIVTGATGSGCFVTELPVGPYSGIWVYMGSDHGVVEGAVLLITGVYEEYYDLSEINVGGSADGSFVVLDAGPVPAPFSLTADELMADPEVFESVAICITDGMMVQDVPSSYGEWFADVLDTDHVVMFDDFWYDDSTVMAGQCYNHACGVLNYNFGSYKLEAYADGIEVVDCTVPTETTSLSDVKSLFR